MVAKAASLIGLSDKHKLYMENTIVDGSYDDIIQIGTKGMNALLLCGFPEWSRETHHLFPATFKQHVKVLLMMALLDENKKPRHPESFFHLLPVEIIHIIILSLAESLEIRKVFHIPELLLLGEDGINVKLMNTIHIPSGMPIEVACSYGCFFCLTTDGLYTWGPMSFSEHGWREEKTTPTKVAQLDSFNIKRVWAGYYYGLVLVEEHLGISAPVGE